MNKKLVYIACIASAKLLALRSNLSMCVTSLPICPAIANLFLALCVYRSNKISAPLRQRSYVSETTPSCYDTNPKRDIKLLAIAINTS